MLRLDPSEGRIRTARSFKAWEGGGEYNVARGLRRCFGLRAAVATAIVKNEVGLLLEDFILQGGVDMRYVRWLEGDGVGRTVRNSLNFTERGFGVRGAVGCSDRGHSAAASLKAGDIGCHILDIPITAFDLPAPSRVSSRQRGGTSLCVPLQDEVVYEFPTSRFGKPIKITWYSGVIHPDENGEFPADYDTSFLPPLPKEYTDMRRGYAQLSPDGMFIIGTEGAIYSPAMHLKGKPVILPKKREAEFVEKLAARTAGFANTDHRLNFLQGIAGDVKKCNSDFSVAGPLSEIVQLGNITLQTGRSITWDSANMRCVGDPAATAFVNPPMRPEYL